jgi:hypothetical protein
MSFYAVESFGCQGSTLVPMQAACYRSAHLGSFMPAVERYVDNDDGMFRDAAGNVMPACIVMERGESLRDRMKIAHADRAGIAQVCSRVV